MKKLKHSKYKNTGILFELLVRQIATDTLNNRDSVATKIIKEHFSKNTELAKELRLYKLFIEENFTSEYKASEFVNIILNERTKLNESSLSRQKYNLIKVTDKVTKIKVNEVLKLITKVKSSKVITESQILSLLRYTELHDELKRVFK